MAEKTINPRVDDGATQERFGPLALLRVRKDGDRALILYSRADDGTGAGAPPHAEPAGDDGPA